MHVSCSFRMSGLSKGSGAHSTGAGFLISEAKLFINVAATEPVQKAGQIPGNVGT